MSRRATIGVVAGITALAATAVLALTRHGSAGSIGAPPLAGAAQPGEVLVSGTVKDIVAGSGIAFAERGEHELHGVPGAWRLFTATTV